MTYTLWQLYYYSTRTKDFILKKTIFNISSSKEGWIVALIEGLRSFQIIVPSRDTCSRGRSIENIPYDHIYLLRPYISLATIAATHFCNLFNEIVVARFKVRFVREISERCFVITIEILRVLSQLRIIFKFCF